MKDRMEFEKVVLPNGMTIYGKHTDDPFVYVDIYIPVGHMHNTGAVLPGTAHFLEHMVCNRSAMFPELDSFAEYVDEHGGSSNATTSRDYTKYSLSVPKTMFTHTFRGLISRVFEPLLDPTDIATEVSVISNERKRRSKWFPGDSELGHYLQTQWKNSCTNSLVQMLGDDSDLSRMNTDDLIKLHQAYFTPRVYVVVGGGYDLDFMCRELSRIDTRDQQLDFSFNQIQWNNRLYHEKVIADTKNFTYRIGGIFDSKDTLEHRGLILMGKILTSSPKGKLYEWLRKKLGWSYTIGFAVIGGNIYRNSHWSYNFPVNSHEQSIVVRNELRERMISALSDQDHIDQFINRQTLSDVFTLQTVHSALECASDQLASVGRIYTERDVNEIDRVCAQSGYMLGLFERHFDPEIVGELLTMPE